MLGIGQACFVASLAPAIRARQAPPLLQSVPNAVLLFLFAYIHWTLGLKTLATATLMSATGWTVLAIRGLRHRRAPQSVTRCQPTANPDRVPAGSPLARRGDQRLVLGSRDSASQSELAQ